MTDSRVDLSQLGTGSTSWTTGPSTSQRTKRPERKGSSQQTRRSRGQYSDLDTPTTGAVHTVTCSCAAGHKSCKKMDSSMINWKEEKKKHYGDTSDFEVRSGEPMYGFNVLLHDCLSDRDETWQTNLPPEFWNDSTTPGIESGQHKTLSTWVCR